MIIKPFVAKDLHRVCRHHAVFHGHYYFHHLGLNRDRYQQYWGNPKFAACAELCKKYDQRAFDGA